MAAAAPNVGHGSMLASGFGGLAYLGMHFPGPWISLAIGTCVGTLVGALGRRA